MYPVLPSLVSLLFLSSASNAAIAPQKLLSRTTSASSAAVSVTLNGKTYVNKGLVGFGLIPSNFRESTGDTLGGIGSAIAIKSGTWSTTTTGTFQGTLVVHPDRGFNVDGAIDYQSRRHEINFVLTPYTGSANLNFTAAQQTLTLNYIDTTLEFERNATKTSGLDPIAVRPAQAGATTNPLSDPAMPIASNAEPHLTIDAEGIISNADGSFWVSDEYGPYIYRFAANGSLIQTIQPPAAILPHDDNGALNFSALNDPTTGRAANSGFEGLTIDDNGVLYAMLQTATIQDGGDDKGTSRYTRLVAYNISNPDVVHPSLIGEWVVPLPLNSKSNTLGCSEIHFVSGGVFLALSRDGHARGDDDEENESSYKQADLFDITGATDIHGTTFDDPANAIAKKGKLNKNITPATYVSFVNYLDDTQLARFGLHNGDPNDETLIDAKWESLALAPVGDPLFPNDFFLFTASDNDFISEDGVSLGVPFNAGLNVDNQFLVFQVTLPGLTQAAIKARLGV
ncbi:esterase-like activity of phytase-domain-containing protein [Mycena floridula]|nr:esterase-like activity of phytase-domain-containing protein [Mycena floridula]